MPRFATLPSDLLKCIILQLSLVDVLSVRQVCKFFQEAISTDKWLWIHILKRYVIDGGKCVIPYRRPLTLVDAAAVESWTRNAFVLEKAYVSTSRLYVHRLDTGIRAVTWVKLIRGRWCLAASSNTSESRLTLWDISSPDNQICSEMLFPGPIMDGEIEDLNTEIIIAVSVGCRERYVQILNVGTSACVPQILKRNAIPGADRVLCLRGSYLGVAVVDGDDSNPILLDWKRGTQWVLKPSVPIASLDDRTTCLAMTIWDAFVVVAFPDQLHVYTYPESRSGDFELLYTHSVFAGLTDIIEVRFVNNESLTSSFPGGMERTAARPLYAFLKGNDGEYYMQVLDANGQLQDGAVECDVPQLTDDDKSPVGVLSMTIGYSGRKFLGLISSSIRHCLPPRILIASIRPPQFQAGCDSFSCDNNIYTNYHVLPTADFPLLHFWSCFDFDDSRGVLLTGTSRGEICVARFVHGDIILPGSLIDELPPLHINYVEKEHPYLVQVPVKMDLPPYYLFRECLMNDDIPAHIVDQLTYSWKLPADVNFSAPGWSSDWHSFRNLKRWAMPSLRWGHMDPDMLLTRFLSHSSVNEIRISYGYLGEPYPVAFLQDDHDVVIFRIGTQAFLMQWDGIAVFRQPLQELSQLLQNTPVHELTTLHLHFVEWRGKFFDTSVQALLEHGRNFDAIIEHAAMSDDFALDPNPNIWTNKEWNQAQSRTEAEDDKDSDVVSTDECWELDDHWEDDGYL
ncbi:hypothetical protein BD410DRAFT_726828 [Rickenella mellea]|uniref:F-box domain-containing protein n=1 Tax=Rickenella mellea TaxID=50990 RepID=A0A4Y7PXG5_9AGAM|nr:hypothetical protein BD410DRAFT_726828 [Rickenella mellea]